MRFLSQQGLGLCWLIEQNPGLDFFLAAPNNSPWLQVDFPTGDKKYAIWNSTGSVYECEGPYDAVADDPIYTPPDYSRLEGTARALALADRYADKLEKLTAALIAFRKSIEGEPVSWSPEALVLWDAAESATPGTSERARQ